MSEPSDRRTDRTPEDLDAWVDDLATALGLDGPPVPTGALLDLTREVAHGVVRAAGPLSTYLVGLAVANGTDVDEAVATTRGLVEQWTKDEE